MEQVEQNHKNIPQRSRFHNERKTTTEFQIKQQNDWNEYEYETNDGDKNKIDKDREREIETRVSEKGGESTKGTRKV